MRHLPVEPPAFFPRGPSPLARLAFFGLVSIGLLFVDTRYHYLEGMRSIAATIVYPLQRAAQLPGQALLAVGSHFVSKQSLAGENALLKQRLVEQSATAQGFPSAQQENARLRALLDMKARSPTVAVAVEVLYTSRDPFAQKVFIDKGADADLRPGEAVIDAVGVIGQVTRVFPFMAEVTLLTDKDHAVPVKVQRSGARSVLYGAGTGRAPELRFMAPSADVQVGDLLETSGLDGTYPPGLAVARVTTVERETGQVFARITCEPLAGVDRSEQLLVVGRAAAAPARPAEPVEVEAAKKPGRAKRRAAGGT